MGFFSSPKLVFDPTKDIPDLSGKVVLITGGNGGIGYATLKQLALHGAKVYMGARTEWKAVEAIKKLEETGGVEKGKVIWHKVDLATVKTARESAEEFLKKEERLDILVNNAGQLTDDYALSEDGVCTVLGSNHIGPTMFTLALLPLLKQTATKPDSDVRIIMVASESYKYLPSTYHLRTFEDLKGPVKGNSVRQKMTRYGASKYGNILFTKELQRRLDEEGVNLAIVAVYPGAVYTDGVTSQLSAVPFAKPLFSPILKTVFLTPDKGALNSLFAATAPLGKDKVEKGEYYPEVGKVKKFGEDWDVAAKENWELMEKVGRGEQLRKSEADGEGK